MKLFVYGTLQEGEPLNTYLRGSKLLTTLEVPGALYDTGMGYPAATFEPGASSTVTGELFYLHDGAQDRLKTLDKIEGAAHALFRRKIITHGDHSFFAYEASKALAPHHGERRVISTGSWRRHASTAKTEPARFALEFAASESLRYKELPPQEWDAQVYLRGDVPVLLTAPHATRHWRMGKVKYQDRFTGPLALIVHCLTGCHTLYTHWASERDPNYYYDAPFKRRLAEVVGAHEIKLVIDLHGTVNKSEPDIYPGVGVESEFLLGREQWLEILNSSLKEANLTSGGTNVFKASVQDTVTKYSARSLGVPAMQLEIHERLRHPESSPEGFETLVRLLASYIESLDDL
ncbi:MAG: gamma-glutamylcyclotransferase [Thermodesulfobacteriota bacterium]